MQQKGLIYKQHNQKTVGHKTYPPGIKSLSIIVLFLQNAGVYICTSKWWYKDDFLELSEI